MPTYQYRCTECGHDLEVVQKFTDSALTECPNCRGQLRKIFNAVGVVFKGSGFYRTDSREKVSENGSTGSSSKTDSGNQESGNNKSGNKDSGSKESGGQGSGSGGKESGGSAPAKTDGGSGSGSASSKTSGQQPVGSGSSSTGQKSSST